LVVEVDEEDLKLVAVGVLLDYLVYLFHDLCIERGVEHLFNLSSCAGSAGVADEEGSDRGRHVVLMMIAEGWMLYMHVLYLDILVSILFVNKNINKNGGHTGFSPHFY